MSEKENMKIDALERKTEILNKKVGEIYTAISGDPNLGLKGIVETLNEHVTQSKKNHELLLIEFKNFKRGIGLEYAQSFNAVDLNVNHNKQDIDYVSNRVKVLEENDKKEGNRLGFAAVVSGAIGTAIGFLISAFK